MPFIISKNTLKISGIFFYFSKLFKENLEIQEALNMKTYCLSFELFLNEFC